MNQHTVLGLEHRSFLEVHVCVMTQLPCAYFISKTCVSAYKSVYYSLGCTPGILIAGWWLGELI